MKYYLNLCIGIIFGGVISAIQVIAALMGIVNVVECSVIAMISGAICSLLSPLLASKYKSKYIDETDLTSYIFMGMSILIPLVVYIIIGIGIRL